MKIIGHRGAKGLAPENTAASFKAAIEAKVDLIELDIRTSSDGKLVVNHDSMIGGLEISKSTLEKLKSSKPDLITLNEALKVIATRVPIIIEVKKGTNIEVAIKELKNFNLPPNTQISSFNMPIILAVKRAFPLFTIIVNEKWSGVRGSYRCRKLGTKYLTMNQRWLWFGFIKSMAHSGYKLSAYPLNDIKKAKKWAKHGLYAAVTDFPDKF